MAVEVEEVRQKSEVATVRAGEAGGSLWLKGGSIKGHE
jgi:hypothetical protein